MIMGKNEIVAETHFPAGRGTSYKDSSKTRFHSPFRRLSDELSGKRIGLALSCGGAKGLAHVGVIQTLEELGIIPDIIAGSSMGAYVAALWAKGNDAESMEAMALEHSGLWGALKLVDPSP